MARHGQDLGDSQSRGHLRWADSERRTAISSGFLETDGRVARGAERGERDGSHGRRRRGTCGCLRSSARFCSEWAQVSARSHQILPIFRDKYLGDSVGTRIDINSVESLLSSIRAREELEELKRQRDEGTGAMRGKSKAQKRNLLRKQRSHRSAKFSVPQLLAVLKAGSRSETESIRFDYISMHVRCLSALRAVKNASHTYLASKLGPEYIRSDYELPAIVGRILNVAVQSRLQAEAQGRQLLPGQRFASKLLAGATSTLDTFLKSSPDEASKELIKLRLIAVAE